MIKLIVITAILIAIVLYSVIAVPPSDYDRKIDDEAQIEYLKNERKKQ